MTSFDGVAGLHMHAEAKWYLVDSGKDGAGGGAPKGVDHPPKDDRHDHLRHAACDRRNCADQHQHHICDVCVFEQFMQRRLTTLVQLLRAILLSSISSSSSGCFLHAMHTRYSTSCLSMPLCLLCGDLEGIVPAFAVSMSC